jgi:predicted dehydrogenase
LPFERLQQLWPMPNHPLPIMMIGAGGVVQDAHLPAYKKWRFPVAGIYDPDMERAKSLAQQYDIAIVHSSLEEAMQAGEGIVLDIAVPPGALPEILPLIPAGRIALIQKPLGTGLDEAKKLAAILKGNEVTAACNFQLRFTPAMLAVADAVKKGMFGEINELEVRLACRTPWEEWPFMRHLEAVEIPLHSIHYLDWIRALLGQPEKVYAKSLPHPDHEGLADARSSIILDYGDAVRCCLSLSHTHKWGAKHEEATLRIEGAKGAAIVGLGYLVNFPHGKPETLDMIIEGGQWQSISLAGARMPDAFAGVMANLQRFAAGEDDELETSIPRSVATMALAGACLTSSASGEAVSVEFQD